MSQVFVCEIYSSHQVNLCVSSLPLYNQFLFLFLNCFRFLILLSSEDQDVILVVFCTLDLKFNLGNEIRSIVFSFLIQIEKDSFGNIYFEVRFWIWKFWIQLHLVKDFLNVIKCTMQVKFELIKIFFLKHWIYVYIYYV